MKFFTFTMQLGDAVEAAVKPIAKAINHPCLDETGKLKPDSGCAKVRNALNRRWTPKALAVDRSPK